MLDGSDMFETFKKIAENGKINYEDTEKLAEFKRINMHYHTGRGESYKNFAGEKVRKYRSGIMTDIGDIEESEWAKMAHSLIEKYGEQEIYERLKKYERYSNRFLAKQPTEKDIEIQALILHIRRIFENPKWLYYKEFNGLDEKG